MLTERDVQLNKSIYVHSGYTRTVIARRGLQPPEKTAFDIIFAEQEGKIGILDVGVGGGRTTDFLLDKAARYVGVDYSSTMIEACQKRFEGFENAKFLVRDARNLEIFEDSEFDLVVFSFNGLDNLDTLGREQALREMYRVLRNGGYLLFSSHSTGAVRKLFSFWGSRYRYSILPLKLLTHLYSYITMRILNGHIDLASMPEMVAIKYGDLQKPLKQIYISPTYQVRTLKQLGFGEIKVLSMTGLELDQEQMKLSEDNWLYYLCRKFLEYAV